MSLIFTNTNINWYFLRQGCETYTPSASATKLYMYSQQSMTELQFDVGLAMWSQLKFSSHRRLQFDFPTSNSLQTLSQCRKKIAKQFPAVQEERGTLLRCQEPAISNKNTLGWFVNFGYPSITYGVHAFHWSVCFDTHPPNNSARKNIDSELSKTSKNII